jgi:hypothetical protein
MSMENRSFEERLSLAINSSDFGILNELMQSASSKIRRAVARNINTPKDVLNELAYDPVLNVSYKAMENPNCSIKREIDEEIHPCVSCNVAEDKKNCRSVCKAGVFV